MKEKIHTQYILSEGITAEGDSSKGGRIDFWKLTTYKTQTIDHFDFHESRDRHSLSCVKRGLQSDDTQLKDVKISKNQLNIQENIQESIKSVRQPILAQSQELVSQILDKPNQLRGGGAGKKNK